MSRPRGVGVPCPRCASPYTHKHGQTRGKAQRRCRACGRSWVVNGQRRARRRAPYVHVQCWIAPDAAAWLKQRCAESGQTRGTVLSQLLVAEAEDDDA